MPEVIEVLKYRDFLLKKLKNKFINKINILQGKYKKHGPFDLYNIICKELPLKVIDIKTKGKFLYFILEKNFYIFSTLGLSGGWTYLSNSSSEYELPLLVNYIKTDIVNSYKKRSLNHLNIEFQTDKGSIYFYDTLSFGTLKVVNNINDLNKKLRSIGPDIMDENTTFEIFRNNISKLSQLDKPIGNILLNQKLVSGIGNYLRSDILWLSKISPFRKLKDLTFNELKLIYKNTKFLIWSEYNYNKGIKLGYIKNNDKIAKNYNRNFFIYNQKNDIYGNPVSKNYLEKGNTQRYIHWVKNYQI